MLKRCLLLTILLYGTVDCSGKWEENMANQKFKQMKLRREIYGRENVASIEQDETEYKAPRGSFVENLMIPDVFGCWFWLMLWVVNNILYFIIVGLNSKFAQKIDFKGWNVLFFQFLGAFCFCHLCSVNFPPNMSAVMLTVYAAVYSGLIVAYNFEFPIIVDEQQGRVTQC